MNLGFDMKTEEAEIAELKAVIAKESALGGELPLKIEDLAASIAKAEADLDAATKVRAKEAADFLAEEKELLEIIDMLDRAITVLQREMAKSGASMLEIKNANTVAEALNAMVRASMFSMADAARITALAQSSQESDAGDVSAPDAAVYKSHSGDIVETLQDLMDKAQAQLAAARKKEVGAVHAFQILKLSLQDQIKFDTKEMDDAKADLAASGEKKTVAESNLAVTTKDLDADIAALADLKADCAAKAKAYEATKVSIASELKAMAEAKRALSTSEGG